MKKQIISWGMMLAAAFTLTNCAQEIENPNEQPETVGYPFEIVASTVDTKTVNDGMSTKWDADDKINLFHAVCDGTNYKNNGAFTVKDVEEGTFNGNLFETLDPQEEYDWYALYPYNEKIITPAQQTAGYTYIGYSKGLNQTGYNSMASLKETVCPLYGVLKSCPAGDKPVFEMQHLSSVVAINVTNANEEPLTVTTASLTAEEDIVGSYYFDLTTTPVTITKSGDSFVYKTATVNVTSGATALAKGESAVLYLAIKPFTAATGEKLVLSVNGYEKELTMTKDVTFTAGKIKILNFSYDNEEERESISIPWSEDFSGDISQYSLVSGGSTTKLYDTDPLAGGEAPELLVSKTNGSFSATIATGGYIGELTLTFKSNHPDYLTVTSTTEGVEITKNNAAEYVINISAQVESFDLTFKNTQSSNTRLDDIELVKGAISSQAISFEKSTVSLELGSDDFSAFTGQAVNGAMTDVTYASDNTDVAEVDSKTGVVTLKSVAGSATITATAVATEEYRGATAEYVILLSEPIVGGADINITVDWATNVGSLGTSGLTQSFVIDGYPYSASGTSCYYYSTGKALFLGKTGAYVQLPAINGYKLTKVVLTSASSTGGASVTITDVAGSSATGTTAAFKNGTSAEFTFDISAPVVNQSYRIKVTNSKNAHIAKWVLTYQAN